MLYSYRERERETYKDLDESERSGVSDKWYLINNYKFSNERASLCIVRKPELGQRENEDGLPRDDD